HRLPPPSSSYMRPRPPRSTLFPYTTLFRSCAVSQTKRSGPHGRHSMRRSKSCSNSTPKPRINCKWGSQELDSHLQFILGFGVELDRKSTRLNSSHVEISYAVFCLKKKKIQNEACQTNDAEIQQEAEVTEIHIDMKARRQRIAAHEHDQKREKAISTTP